MVVLGSYLIGGEVDFTSAEVVNNEGEFVHGFFLFSLFDLFESSFVQVDEPLFLRGVHFWCNGEGPVEWCHGAVQRPIFTIGRCTVAPPPGMQWSGAMDKNRCTTVISVAISCFALQFHRTR